MAVWPSFYRPDPELALSELEQIVAQSKAAEPFKVAVLGYRTGEFTDRIRVDGRAPSVKVRRLLTQLLSSEPDLAIEQVTLRAQSGCSDFVGTIVVRTADETLVYDFVWDCKWRAEQEGWTDYFGLPDQIRAAQEFDWRCFQRWEPVDGPSLVTR